MTELKKVSAYTFEVNMLLTVLAEGPEEAEQIMTSQGGRLNAREVILRATTPLVQPVSTKFKSKLEVVPDLPKDDEKKMDDLLPFSCAEHDIRFNTEEGLDAHVAAKHLLDKTPEPTPPTCPWGFEVRDGETRFCAEPIDPEDGLNCTVHAAERKLRQGKL